MVSIFYCIYLHIRQFIKYPNVELMVSLDGQSVKIFVKRSHFCEILDIEVDLEGHSSHKGLSSFIFYLKIY